MSWPLSFLFSFPFRFTQGLNAFLVSLSLFLGSVLAASSPIEPLLLNKDLKVTEACQLKSDDGKCWLLSVMEALLQSENIPRLNALNEALRIHLATHDFNELNPAAQLLAGILTPDLISEELNIPESGLAAHELNQHLANLLEINVLTFEVTPHDTLTTTFMDGGTGTLDILPENADLELHDYFLSQANIILLLTFPNGADQPGHVQAIVPNQVYPEWQPAEPVNSNNPIAQMLTQRTVVIDPLSAVSGAPNALSALPSFNRRFAGSKKQTSDNRLNKPSESPEGEAQKKLEKQLKDIRKNLSRKNFLRKWGKRALFFTPAPITLGYYFGDEIESASREHAPASGLYFDEFHKYYDQAATSVSNNWNHYWPKVRDHRYTRSMQESWNTYAPMAYEKSVEYWEWYYPKFRDWLWDSWHNAKRRNDEAGQRFGQ